MFSRFDTIPACDGQTYGRTDGRTDVQAIAITCFSIADARKNTQILHLIKLSKASVRYDTELVSAVIIVKLHRDRSISC